MCALCDGKSIEQLWEDFHGFIRRGGWALQGVEASRHDRPWVYTIGLVENYRHPELIAVGDDVRAQGSLLNAIGDHVKQGALFVVGDRLDLGGYEVEFGAVDPSYVSQGLCRSWDAYYDWLGDRPTQEFEVLSVLRPLTEWCQHCDEARRVLATPGASGFGESLNRAQRRVRRRHGHR